MADRVIMPVALDAHGDVVSGATAYFYQTSTLSALVVYADQAGTVPLGTTATADAAGVFDPVFTTQGLKLDVRDESGVSLPGFPSNYWYVAPSVGVGGSTITFEPVEGNPATNVSAAIGNLTTLWNAVSELGRNIIGRETVAEWRSGLGLGDLATKDILNDNDLSTASQTRPQSSTAVKTYVDDQIAALPIPEFYESSERTFTDGQLVAATHGLGAAPREVQVFLKCTTADGLFSVGDWLIMPPSDGGSERNGATIRFNNIDVRMQIGADGFRVLDATGNFVSLTNTSWRIVVRAWS